MKLNYKKYGKGKPFVILHGLFGSSDNWHTHGKRLADYYSVYLLDQRNHGDSDWSNEFNYDLMAEDLHEFVQQHNLEEIILMGHSMGGKTAMRFAQLYPDMVEKLIVVDMGVKEYPISHDGIIDGLKSLDLDKITSRSEANKQLESTIKVGAIRQFLLKNLNREDQNSFSWKINLPVLEEKLPEIVKALPNIETMLDVLFISGGQSDYVLAEDHQSIRNIFPLAEFYCIESAGHWIHAEAPEEFMEQVLKFALL
ncbi:alpha/beta hydrolase [Brumimicrobium salinarum]|uniref:Alpha/beta hydrolase n=1 Tax=Brumimicrobium salinarum TaxID=2058658 RepID=A0A2I0R0V9_9FLAO|nr:alpha/beta fold hydrolase [Brumimicrobium salinarum]PKR80213.1 alpha/beta hydrolase [Brumimicrobium salinarum]